MSTDLDTFADTHEFDTSFIAAFIASRGNPKRLATIRRGVAAVAPGGWIRCEGNRVTTGAFWTFSAEPRHRLSVADASHLFRTLTEEAVSAMLSPQGGTWAHLSGGLDSSSVVSIAAALAERGAAPPLGGTITNTGHIGECRQNRILQRGRRPIV